jgi:hypothetical protein
VPAGRPALRRRHRLGVIGGVCLVAAGGYGLMKPAGSSDVGVVPQRRPVSAADPSTSVPASAPARVRIPRLGVDAPVTPVGVLPQGDLDVPKNPEVLGWWTGGARLGEPNGSVVIDGHVDSARNGEGAFFSLRTLRPNDRVDVAGADGSERRYVVTGLRRYAKSALPAATVFSPTVSARLVLITCGGRFDRSRGHYRDNIVVYAVAATAAEVGGPA